MKTLYSDDIKKATPAEKRRSLLILSIFVIGLLIRIPFINSHPTSVHATRQYHSALLARSFYLNTGEHKDDIGRIPSVFFQRYKEQSDPRINEKIIYQMYRMFGKEDMVIPRLMSVLYWLIGGVIIYKIGLLLFGGTGSLITLIFYLFFPFGINMSQSIQPESLLNMFFLWGVLQIIKHFRSEKGDYFYSAAMLSGFAVLIKATIIVPILGLLLFLGIHKYGLKKYLFNWRTVWFYTIFLSIGASFYIYNIYWNKVMQGNLSILVMPKLLLTSSFWVGWLTQIAKVTGVIPFLIALFLLLIIKEREIKYPLAGLFLGYIFYALIFTYTSATHDYYQITLFPITALLLGYAGTLIKKGERIKYAAVFSLLVAGVIFSLWHQYKFVKSDHEMKMYSPAYFFVGEQGSYFYNNTSDGSIWGNSFEAGELIGHGINNILLSRSYGNAVMYYGKMFGRWWPTEEDFNLMRLRGKNVSTAKELYNSRFAPQHPKYFIITDFRSWKEQPGLQKFLNENFKLFAEKENGFIIYDLRNRKKE